MSLLSDTQITHLCQFSDTAMISPFSPVSSREASPGLIGPSFGLSSTGYDIRLSNKFMKHVSSTVVRNGPGDWMPASIDTCVRPKLGLIGTNLFEKATQDYTTIESDQYVLAPGEFILAVSMEHFKIPNNVMGLCTGKSTLARLGILVFVTPLEAGWEGYLTLEIVNLGNAPVILHQGIGICQINFFKAEDTPYKSYLNRSGRYQDQPNSPVPARIG